MTLSEEQERILVTPAGVNIIIEAVAGSGKTTVLLLRIVTLVQTKRYKAENFLLLTFNVRTRVMIKERLAQFAASFPELNLLKVRV